MSNVWMTSEGLDIALEEEPQKVEIKVCYGELEGTFISIDSNHSKLVFETSDIELAFKYISEAPNFATISYANFTHKLLWKKYNYKIKKASKYTLVITVEENNGK
tara:strand:+ start:183 stop:497 length:315 start_codon:yes stop_codon:yes gene_type:complete